MTEAAVERAAALLARRIGLRIEGPTRGRLARALRDEAEARGVDPGELTASSADLERLVDRITVQETRFFRDPPHFEVLVRHALSRRRAGVIWSAGCASGQEPWSLAITLEEAGADGWRVLATDVSQHALARTRAGVYTERELDGVSAARRTRYFDQRHDGRWEAGPRLRTRVLVRAHNLAEEPAPLQAEVVFCRNVLIYLDADATARALDALHAALPPDGWLFLGGSEALTGGPFKPQRIDGTYVYRPAYVRPLAGSAAAAREAAVAAAEHAAAARRTVEAHDARAAQPVPTAAEITAQGEAHAAAEQFAAAADAFRRAAELTPGDPLAHVRLGLALEQAGEREPAARAYGSARDLLAGAAMPELGGWAPAVLARWLDEKLAGPG